MPVWPNKDPCRGPAKYGCHKRNKSGKPSPRVLRQSSLGIVPVPPPNLVPLMDSAFNRLHPPWTGHVATAVTVFYNVLHAALEFCQDLILQNGTSPLKRATPSTDELWLDPRLRPSLPSAVDTSSSLALEWERKDREWQCHGQGPNDYPFAWIVAKEVHDKLSLPNIHDVIVDAKGWSYETTDAYNLHHGLEAQEANATVVLKVDVNNPHKGSVLDLFYMKSYSKKWKGRWKAAHTWIVWRQVLSKSFQLSGFQATRTSEYFPHKQSFVTSGLQTPVFIKLKLIGGSTFKIGGLAVCSEKTT